ncbi:MAG: hypothetical protein GXO69_04905 [Acidobacteria bacterium]|nr:hypothetical protein [Acidobacteriota bacterium]
MAKSFVELVVSSPYILLKGFLMGYLAGSGEKARYYFNRKSGIESETLKDHLKNWLGIENSVHLCLDEELAKKLETAIRENHEKLGMEVISRRKIIDAGFELKARFFDEDGAKHFRNELNSLKGRLSVTVTADGRSAIPAWQDVGVGVMATLPPYQFGIDAKVTGPLDELLEFHRKLSAETLVDVSEIQLTFENE